MATKKDLVEAYSFSRRRLVTAFVSGAPGGREVEPSRPGRAIIGGLALAVLFVAGAAVLGILKSPVDIDLEKPQLVSEKESGADYVILAPAEGAEPELRPVANITSAMLLLGADVTPTVVPHDEIAKQDRGEGIGILEAPETPPEAGALIQSAWTGCTGAVNGEPVGLKVDINQISAVTLTPEVSFVVSTDDGRLFLIAESTTGSDSRLPRAYAYPVPMGASADRILQGVAANSDQNAIRVPDDWLTMFPSGGPLTLATFGISKSDLGRPSPFRSDPAVPDGADIGDVLEVGDQRYVLTRTGALRLDDFSSAVYLNQSFPARPDADLPASRRRAGPEHPRRQRPAEREVAHGRDHRQAAHRALRTARHHHRRRAASAARDARPRLDRDGGRDSGRWQGDDRRVRARRVRARWRLGRLRGDVAHARRRPWVPLSGGRQSGAGEPRLPRRAARRRPGQLGGTLR